MKYGYKIVRKLSSEALRILCIERDWYDAGDNEEYGNMLVMAKKKEMTSVDIVEIATDIGEHSTNIDFDDFEDVCDAILDKTYSFISEI